MIEGFRKLIGPLQHRVAMMVSRAVIALVEDAGGRQTLQMNVLAGEVMTDVERFQNYGMTSVPQVGAEAVLVCVAGNRSHPLVIAAEDRRYRLKALQAGEVALYDDIGHVVHLTRTGIVIEGGGQNISITGAPQVVVTGGDVVADGISLKTHVRAGVMGGDGDTSGPVG